MTGVGPGRVQGLDVLRGFALSGILLVNAQVMAGPYGGLGGGPETSATDRAAAWAVTALAEGKFYLLFSFLFGYSFVLQERAADAEGAAFAARHLRRTVGLFALGTLHAVLLYPGDILTMYAVLALPLYGLRRLAPRTALRLAAGLVATLSLLLLVYGLLTVSTAGPPDAPHPGWAADTVAAHRGDAGAVIGVHLHDLRAQLGADLLYAPDIFAAFLAGLAAARLGLAEGYGRDRARLRRVVVWWLSVGLAGGVATAVCVNGPLDGRWFFVGRAVDVLTAPALTASYACGLLRLVRGWPARVLAAAGRTALTNYLTQSLVLALVFTGYGLGRYGRTGTAAVLAGCLLLYVLQLAASRFLTARVRYGPAELLLRTVTLARRPAPSGSSSPAGPLRSDEPRPVP
ncbi:DUF418 domain-containing protein [Streptomyces sp. NBC_01462]|uniref:DUF418 domain-containing protein n=1 Tax=Streptomyces sp. NBC_01462 TaxID=2903876 RepID=UPI002E310BE4|nr:DUF418 domain-containing protein [Streptomyces sp. NBC_01462]